MTRPRLLRPPVIGSALLIMLVIAAASLSPAGAAVKPITPKAATAPFKARRFTVLPLVLTPQMKGMRADFGVNVTNAHLGLPVAFLTVYTTVTKAAAIPHRGTAGTHAYRVANIVLDETNVGTRSERQRMLAALTTLGHPIKLR